VLISVLQSMIVYFGSWTYDPLHATTTDIPFPILTIIAPPHLLPIYLKIPEMCYIAMTQQPCSPKMQYRTRPNSSTIHTNHPVHTYNRSDTSRSKTDEKDKQHKLTSSKHKTTKEIDLRNISRQIVFLSSETTCYYVGRKET
jgi:hypothetical protein